MSEDKSLTVNGLVGELLRRLLGREALMLLAFTAVVGGGAIYASTALAQSVKSGVDAGVRPLEARVQAVEEREKAQQRFNERMLEALQGMEDRSARRFDALQNTILERRPQPESAELAKPAPIQDGGR